VALATKAALTDGSTAVTLEKAISLSLGNTAWLAQLGQAYAMAGKDGSAARDRASAAIKTQLLDQVRREVRARHFSRRIEDANTAWTHRFIPFHDERPAELNAEHVAVFLRVSQTS